MRILSLVTIAMLCMLFAAAPYRPPYTADKPLAEPTIFGEGVLSNGDYNLNAAFTPDGKTVYFTKGVQDTKLGVIVFSEFRNGVWQTPKVASFSGQYTDYDPFITADGNKLFYCSDRPLPGKDQRDFDIWYVERAATGWSEPKNVGTPVNTSGNEYYPSLAKDGTLYFSSNRPGGLGSFDIYRSKFVDGQYAEPENLGPTVNSESGEIDNYISPDQSFLIFVSTRQGGLGGSDLYISYNENGAWTPAKNLGAPINSPVREFCPMGSPDGKYFFFTSNRSLPMKERNGPLTYAQLRRILDAPGHGLGAIYQMDMEAVHRAAGRSFR